MQVKRRRQLTVMWAAVDVRSMEFLKGKLPAVRSEAGPSMAEAVRYAISQTALEDHPGDERIIGTLPNRDEANLDLRTQIISLARALPRASGRAERSALKAKLRDLKEQRRVKYFMRGWTILLTRPYCEIVEKVKRRWGFHKDADAVRFCLRRAAIEKGMRP